MAGQLIMGEREQIAQLLSQGLSQSEIGRRLGRHRSTIGRELARNGERIIHHAGLTPWPKLFQNLRSSRETELSRKHPLHVVVAWMGNSQPVAMNHYLQVRDEDFEIAASEQTKKTVQKTVQQGAVRGGNGSQAVPSENKEPRNLCGIPGSAIYCRSLRDQRVPPAGVEPAA